MNQDQKIIEVLHDFETFKMSEKEQGVYAHTSSYKPYIE